jgi:hypothetical protein
MYKNLRFIIFYDMVDAGDIVNVCVTEVEYSELFSFISCYCLALLWNCVSIVWIRFPKSFPNINKRTVKLYTVRSESRCALIKEVMSMSVYTGLNPFNFIRKHFLQICFQKVTVPTCAIILMDSAA